MTSELILKIGKLQNPNSIDGRWFHEGQDVFLQVGDELINRGFSENETFNILEKVYRTVANEYGD